jgi:hypothetical protein
MFGILTINLNFMITQNEEYLLVDFLIKSKEGKELTKKDLFNASLIVDKIKTKIDAEIQAILEKAEASDAQNEFNN